MNEGIVAGKTVTVYKFFSSCPYKVETLRIVVSKRDTWRTGTRVEHVRQYECDRELEREGGRKREEKRERHRERRVGFY